MDLDERMASSAEAGTSGRLHHAATAAAAAAVTGAYTAARPGTRQLGGSQPAAAQSLPMLASACPGWVCYAEKTHGDYILPYISSTKSPQVWNRDLTPQLDTVKLLKAPSTNALCILLPDCMMLT